MIQNMFWEKNRLQSFWSACGGGGCLVAKFPARWCTRHVEVKITIKTL